MNTAIEEKTCDNCGHLMGELPSQDYPYVQIWCGSGVFDGLATKEDLDALSEPTECLDWKPKK